MNKVVFLDAESDGLYGDFLSAALLVADRSGNILETYYFGLRKELLINVKTEWVKESVIPIMGEYEICDSQKELLRKVWDVWLKHKDNSYMIADVPYPVECRLLRECVALDDGIDAFSAPFPLLDLSSMMYALGEHPLTDRYGYLGLDNSSMKHNALEDVRVSFNVWRKIRGIKK